MSPHGTPLPTQRGTAQVWRIPPQGWALALLAAALAIVLSFDGVKPMVLKWYHSEEYGYALFMPAVIAFLIWQKRDQLERLPFNGSWIGAGVVLAGLFLMLLGELSTLYIVIQYAFVVVLFGLILTFVGWPAFRLMWVPLLLLLFTIPLPNFLYQGLSATTQLISSQIGVAIIRLFGISVLLEGNVIDLGTYKLQVAEACSGLRYLFPLMALGYLAAYLFKGAWWKKAVIFLSTIPITIFMNSFRIAVIGVLVDRYGTAQAEGFLHDFEGWAIFMACIGLLAAEMWILAKIGRERKTLAEVFGLEFPTPTPRNAVTLPRAVPRPFWGALAVLAVVTASFAALPTRVEEVQPRKDLMLFPMMLDEWQGTPGRIEDVYLDTLKLSDYLFAHYTGAEKQRVGFYVAYYDSQRKGESAHSPRSCIPGGGWQIASLSTVDVRGAKVSGERLRANRVLIQKGESRALVYYWFQQRGRIITNEYLVKWFLFWDALTRNRTDGALVRLTMNVATGADIEEADRQLSRFATAVAGRLPDYIPD